MKKQIEKLKDGLVTTQAILDTAVDFSDEYSHVVEQANQVISQVSRECSSIIQRYSQFVSARVVPRLVLAGDPNAGKSSLFNALLCRYRALVNEKPGTTRDVIEEEIRIDGKSWKLVDTAGIRETADLLEGEGIDIGREYLSASRFWILVVDGTHVGRNYKGLQESYRHIPFHVVWNKKDLSNWKPPDSTENVTGVSTVTSEGIPELWEILTKKLKELSVREEGVLPTASQFARLRRAKEKMDALATDCINGVPPEFLSEKNRECLRTLEAVLGEVTVEDVLDRVFTQFCIGK